MFDVEIRIDLDEEINHLMEHLNEQKYSVDGGYKFFSLWEIIDNNFHLWENRGSSFNATQYLKRFGITLNRIRRRNSRTFTYEFYNDNIALLTIEKKFIFLQFLINFLRQTIRSKITYSNNTLPLVKSVLESINYIIDMSNYTIEKDDRGYFFSKKDENVDSVIHLTKNKSLATLLLSYLDVSIDKDLNAKKTILKHISDYMEPDRTEYDKSNSRLSKKVFFLFNNIHIRHNNEQQITMSDEEKLMWYDNTFQMALHLIRSKYINGLIEEATALTNGDGK